MIIINADDWGRTSAETDAALLCYQKGRITSATAMVFMDDSERAARVAEQAGIDIGLHLNLTQPFSAPVDDDLLTRHHARIVDYLTRRKYAQLVYHPGLRHAFKYVYEAQLREFVRLYGRNPTHIDGHHHMHLCTNILFGDVIAHGEKVRRSFYFWPGERSAANRAYRSVTSRLLTRRYRSTDYFFALSQCLQGDRMERVFALARTHAVELMTHPADEQEYARLLSDDHLQQLTRIEHGSYGLL